MSIKDALAVIEYLRPRTERREPLSAAERAALDQAQAAVYEHAKAVIERIEPRFASRAPGSSA